MRWDKKKILDEINFLEKKIGRMPVKRDNSNLYFLSRKYFGSWNNMMKEAGYNVKYKQKPKVPSLNSNELYYFLGLLCTDGHIQFDKKNKSYRVIIYTSNKNERVMIIKLIKELFDYNASIRLKNYGFSNRKSYEIYISSKKVCEFLNELGVPYGAKSFTIKIPMMIVNTKNNMVWHFIRGAFDGDGSIIDTEYQKFFKICSASKKFIDVFNKLLIEQGVNSACIRQERENLWVLRINRKNDVKRLYPLIYNNSKNYFYPRKKRKWKTIDLKI